MISTWSLGVCFKGAYQNHEHSLCKTPTVLNRNRWWFYFGNVGCPPNRACIPSGNTHPYYFGMFGLIFPARMFQHFKAFWVLTCPFSFALINYTLNPSNPVFWSDLICRSIHGKVKDGTWRIFHHSNDHDLCVGDITWFITSIARSIAHIVVGLWQPSLVFLSWRYSSPPWFYEGSLRRTNDHNVPLKQVSEFCTLVHAHTTHRHNVC